MTAFTSPTNLRTDPRTDTADRPGPDETGPTIEERLAELRALTDGPRRDRMREEIIVSCVPTVQRIARRFASRGESVDDLFQVGMLGLISAVDRFEPDRGTRFFAYATPTVVGEIKRHFRDRGWAVRPPRGVQERWAELNEARGRLSQSLGRSPTIADLAADLDTDEEEIIEAIQAGDEYHLCSLDRSVDDDPDSPTVAETIATLDTEPEVIDSRESVKPVLNRLAARERQILLLRFYGNKTQREIAAIVGLSQMHVSRLIRDSLALLRAAAEGEDDPGPADERRPRAARRTRSVQTVTETTRTTTRTTARTTAARPSGRGKARRKAHSGRPAG
ncbi:SigB/SigF/SigG family RNA polymerase sigma factor [Actinomadura rayongensis]|uniref:SigB/SigF/SigG family RNA polymerase sigma factor n=1 Tax=Actinomadura rayongensis TaxID=1429076 RepID=UPI001F00A075|nr:SigB/SigF/SigG family RNA polymerase sigma factor [Actinomadura rayongensis]